MNMHGSVMWFLYAILLAIIVYFMLLIIVSLKNKQLSLVALLLFSFILIGLRSIYNYTHEVNDQASTFLQYAILILKLFWVSGLLFAIGLPPFFRHQFCMAN